MTRSKLQVTGFQASGIHCGLKKDGALDMALFVSDRPCSAAGVFTTNLIKAAPVLYDQEILAGGRPVKAIVANAGNANACTGQQGLDNTYKMAQHTAQALGCEAHEVLVLSTGVIGLQLPMNIVLDGIQKAVDALAPDGWDQAARAIMTTDTHPKLEGRVGPSDELVGVAKGAGMIAPDMATMLSVMATSANASPDQLQEMLKNAAELSFNRIVIDGDMSTNDTVLMLANGASEQAISPDFVEDLNHVSKALAQSIVRDGEGATKFIHLTVSGAQEHESAIQVARAIATSPLCKTAFYGADPNWGRIIAATGYSGVSIDPDRIALDLVNADGSQVIALVKDGAPLDFDEMEAKRLMEDAEWALNLDLGQGAHHTTVWTCDLSHEYVTINGHYRT